MQNVSALPVSGFFGSMELPFTLPGLLNFPCDTSPMLSLWACFSLGRAKLLQPVVLDADAGAGHPLSMKWPNIFTCRDKPMFGRFSSAYLGDYWVLSVVCIRQLAVTMENRRCLCLTPGPVHFGPGGRISRYRFQPMAIGKMPQSMPRIPNE